MRIAPLTNSIPLLVLQHPQEKRKSFSTVPMLESSLSNVHLRIGLSWRSLQHAWGNSELSGDSGSWLSLVYTDSEMKALANGFRLFRSESRVSTKIQGIVVLDGSWKNVKTMLWRNRWIKKLDRIALAYPSVSNYSKIRRSPKKLGLSTFEASIRALENLDPPNQEGYSHLLEEYRETVEKWNHKPCKLS